MEYSFSGKLKITTFVLMAIGLVGMIVGFMTDHSDHHTRFWGNLLINGFFFTAIGLGALFFLALQYAAEVAWSVAVKRVFEAIMSFIPVGAVILIIVFLAGTFHFHHLYHWMDPAVYDVNSEHYDAIIAGKSAYLNQPFFWIRTLVYFATFILFARYFRKVSLEQDKIGGSDLHLKTVGRAAIFLVMFAVFSSTLSWDWLMSIDTHWFSTLYGWYVFSGMWVTAMIVALLMTIWLKNKGLLPQVNDSHIHDVAKWMFAISFLWSYLWFSQFMLIWYSNIPEEVIYFITRINHYPMLFFGMFFTNLIFPMVVLMSRDAKRNPIFFLPIAIIIFLGHWFDVYLLVTPGTMGEHWHFGFMEIGMFLGFLGLFVFVVLTNLSKAPVMVQQHPFLDETVHHHV
ncbi:MAG: quinol:cytochrome C oxidoreductase [Vicingaceae bacterium]